MLVRTRLSLSHTPQSGLSTQPGSSRAMFAASAADKRVARCMAEPVNAARRSRLRFRSTKSASGHRARARARARARRSASPCGVALLAVQSIRRLAVLRLHHAEDLGAAALGQVEQVDGRAVLRLVREVDEHDFFVAE